MRLRYDVPKWSIKFKLYCMENGMKAVDVAEKTGVSLGSIQAYYIGAKTPRKPTCDKIKNTIGFDMEEAIFLSNRAKEEAQ